MSTITLTLQNVNGDPFVDGGNINITTGTTVGAVFNETSGSVSLSTVLQNDSVTIGGYTYYYDYLGSGDVRGDTEQPAAFIRITSSEAGAPLTEGDTFAIDLTGQPGDPDYPNLQNGNTKLTVADLDTGTPVQFPGVPCFVAGTFIESTVGLKPVESFVDGDIVIGYSGNRLSIRTILRHRFVARDLDANPKLRPVRIMAGALGSGLPKRDLLVSRQHRMLVQSKIAERMFGETEVLIPAVKLTELPGIFVDEAVKEVEYFHLLFDQHEVIYAEGAPTESLFTGPETLKSLSPEAREEILTIFPEVAGPDYSPEPVRFMPPGKQQKQLVARHLKNNQPLLPQSFQPCHL